MKKLNLICVVVVALVLGACKPNEKVIERTIEMPNDDKMEKLVKVDEAMTAEELVDSGEQLMTFTTFPLAEKAFKMALLKDPENLRAQFYTEGFLKFYTAQKGILVRIKPFMRTQGRLKDLEEQIRNLPDVHARRYLLDGVEDIKTVSDIQNYFFEMQKNWNDFRKWLIKNYDKNLTLNLDPLMLLINMGVEGKHACEMIDVQSGRAICNYDNVFKKKIAPADLMMLRQIAGGMVMYFTLFTSYSYEGFDKIAVIDPDGKFTSKQVYTYLNQVSPNVFTLRQKNMMKEVMSIGSDLGEAYKYAIKYHKELCPKGEGQNRQRVGYLFQDGLCAKQNDADFAKYEASLKGAIDTRLYSSLLMREVDTKADYWAWFRNPITDLKAIGPATFTSCGEVSSIIDKTFGGVFVNKDAESFVELKKEIHCHKRTLDGEGFVSAGRE